MNNKVCVCRVNTNMFEIFKKICDAFQYNIIFKENGEIICYNSEEYNFTYFSIEEGLIDWIQTLEQVDSDCLCNGEEVFWNEEIEFIKNLI